MFLVVVIDPFSRRVVGCSLQTEIRRDLVVDALEMAWSQRRLHSNAGLIFYCDRGSQYANQEFRASLAVRNITPSMSRKGNCWDDAPSETLFGSLEVERRAGRCFECIPQAKYETIEWLI